MAERLVIESPKGELVAALAVTDQRGPLEVSGKSLGIKFLGNITEARFSAALREALDEYREIIDQQVLSLVDEALQQVLKFGLVVLILPEGERKRLVDFQLYEGGGAALVAVEEW